VEILNYSSENLALSLSNEYTPSEVITRKHHFVYLKNYLSSAQIGAKTIVIERKYINKDYLDDYSFYYSSCFKDYGSVCTRVHFFSNEFKEGEFLEIIKSSPENHQAHWNSYLGFVVVKPIPYTVIGFTILKTYTEDVPDMKRNFWGLRNYKVHLFGNKITVNSLAFQEQDSVLAACATTAIWSMLNKASTDFHTVLKSPSEITKDADRIGFDGNRLFPNKGLTLIQICQAIHGSGLVSEIKSANYPIKDSKGEVTRIAVSATYLKQIINAYSSIGIPIILYVDVPNGDGYGGHAITISGHCETEIVAKPKDEADISYLSDNIVKLYAHDDQFGPFVKIEFNSDFSITSAWTEIDSKHKPTFVNSAVVSLYPKIRIKYEDINCIVLGLDRILTFFFDSIIVNDLVWDIKLTYSEDFKNNIKSASLGDEEKLKILQKSLPRYIWIADCYIGLQKAITFTFDATDISNGMNGLNILFYFKGLKDELKAFINAEKEQCLLLLSPETGITYYDFIIDELE
jgi:hypothetical protein